MIDLYRETKALTEYYSKVPHEASASLYKYLKERFEKLSLADMVRAYIAIDHTQKPFAKVFFARYLYGCRIITEVRGNPTCPEDVVVWMRDFFKDKPEAIETEERGFQQLLLEHVQKSGVNIVTCPDCGQVFLVEIGQRTHECICCEKTGVFETIKLEENRR